MPAICQAAMGHHVLFADGTWFFPSRQGYNAMRLSFSLNPDAIEQGISILGRLLKDER
jgi:DNA-binding transcriptional MocR family regulator